MLKKFFIKLIDSSQYASEVNRKVEYQNKLLEDSLLLSGKKFSFDLKNVQLDSIQEAEFKVFSQFGDDGIIQYLIHNIDVPIKSFIEFGVENYNESNTRFLLFNNNWKGLIMDASENNINYIRKSKYYWKYDLTAKTCFITTENINQQINQENINGKIGLLSIDIDGNDYWIWNAIDVVNPIIVIIEYNSLFGIDKAITVPYKSEFSRFEEHHSGLYAGASLKALYKLALKKGYQFVGTNSSGNNAYFVLGNYLNGNIRPLSLEEGFTESKFREHRNKNGDLTFISKQEAKAKLKDLPVYNVENDNIENFL